MKNLIVPGKFVSQMHPIARSHFQHWAEYMYNFPEAAIIMRYHDRSDKPGEAAIRETFAEPSERVRLLYHILKDADALDRWRLEHYGLDPDYLRTDEVIHLIGFARILVARTLPSDW